MAIFERDKLPLVAGVEQVSCLCFTTITAWFSSRGIELRNGSDSGWQDTQILGGRDGAASRQPGGHASCSVMLYLALRF